MHQNIGGTKNIVYPLSKIWGACPPEARSLTFHSVSRFSINSTEQKVCAKMREKSHTIGKFAQKILLSVIEKLLKITSSFCSDILCMAAKASIRNIAYWL